MELLFELGGETILVVINRKEVKFGNTKYGAVLADITGLKLSYEGVYRQFPDLETVKDWKQQACKRFKEKINSMNSEDEISDYIIKELKTHGYIPKFKRRKGFRPVKL